MIRQKKVSEADLERRRKALEPTKRISILPKIKIEKSSPLELLRMVQLHNDFQLVRIMQQNRMSRDFDNNRITEVELSTSGLKSSFDYLYGLEMDYKKYVEKHLNNFLLYNKYLSRIMGLGPLLSGELITLIGDMQDHKHVSSLWQYSGNGMNRYCNNCKIPMYKEVEYENEMGEITIAKRLTSTEICPFCNNQTQIIVQKKMSGYQINWNPRLRNTCWKVGVSFVKQSAEKSRYRRLYDQIKLEVKRDHPLEKKVKGKKRKDYTPMHIHNMAIRKVVKIFLSHYWVRARTLDQLPITQPYTQKYLNHDMLEPFTDEE